jgi:hypothetical protein
VEWAAALREWQTLAKAGRGEQIWAAFVELTRTEGDSRWQLMIDHIGEGASVPREMVAITLASERRENLSPALEDIRTQMVPLLQGLAAWLHDQRPSFIRRLGDDRPSGVIVGSLGNLRIAIIHAHVECQRQIRTQDFYFLLAGIVSHLKMWHIHLNNLKPSLLLLPEMADWTKTVAEILSLLMEFNKVAPPSARLPLHDFPPLLPPVTPPE